MYAIKIPGRPWLPSFWSLFCANEVDYGWWKVWTTTITIMLSTFISGFGARRVATIVPVYLFETCFRCLKSVLSSWGVKKRIQWMATTHIGTYRERNSSPSKKKYLLHHYEDVFRADGGSSSFSYDERGLSLLLPACLHQVWGSRLSFWVSRFFRIRAELPVADFFNTGWTEICFEPLFVFWVEIVRKQDLKKNCFFIMDPKNMRTWAYRGSAYLRAGVYL